MNKPLLTYALTFLSGLLLGWLALGWWLWPVAYVGDAYTYELNQQDKLAYTSAVVDSFALTEQADPAWFAQWTPEEVNQALEQVAQANPAKANWARALANQVSVSMPQPVQVKARNQASESGVLDWLPYLALAVVVVGLVGGGLWITRSAAQAKAKFEAERDFSQPQRYAAMTTIDYVPTQPKPIHTLAQARLEFGPDQPTDQHLPIERDGQHLGEFGVSQVEDEPAWDVWLFDQKALVTVTKVLANQASEELSGRGEVIGLNSPVVLDTPGLRMTGKAVQFGNGITVELSVEGKDE